MKQSRLLRICLLALPFLAVSLVWSRGIRSSAHAHMRSQDPANSLTPPQQLSEEGQASLRAIINAGNLQDLRWPNFSDYTAHVRKFYDFYGNALPWLRGMQPTPQAQQLIGILLNAEQKGLSADDYDGPRWNDRLEKLKPASHPSEADAGRFDAALTVCVMRYVSDLHIGKVNPKHFDFGFDVDVKKYDLPEFLKENVVDAPNVPAVLVQIEPPYPGYQRTIEALQKYIELAKKDSWEQLPAITKTIAPGDSYAGVPRLTRLLQLVGDLPADAKLPADETVYQGPVVDGVKVFQRRLDRTEDGG